MIRKGQRMSGLCPFVQLAGLANYLSLNRGLLTTNSRPCDIIQNIRVILNLCGGAVGL